MNEKNESKDTPASEASPKARKTRRTLLVGLVTALLVIVALPWIIAKTPLRNVLLNTVVGDPELRVSSGAASFGWVTPLELTTLEITHPDESLQIRVDRLSAEKSWLGLLLSRPELGRFEFDGPALDVVLRDEGAEPAPSSAVQVTLTAVITDAHVVLRDQPQADPVIDLEGVNLTLHIEEGQVGRVLVVDPITVFDHLALTQKLCDDGLQLVAPILANEVSVQGAVSLEFTKFQIPLDATHSGEELQDVEVAGRLGLHGVSARLKNEITRQLTVLVANLLNAQIPSEVRLAEEVSIDFEVRDRRVFHEGLAFALPEISPDFWIRTSGSVGFDETLDLRVELQVPSELSGDTPLGRRLAATPLDLRVTGTIDEPKIGVAADQPWLERLAGSLLDGDISASDKELSDDLREMIGNLLDRREGSRRRPGGLLERLFGQ